MTDEFLLGKTNLSLVKRDNLREVLTKFGLKIVEDENNGNFIIFKTGEDEINEISAKCEGCGTDMTLGNFGHLAKGSKLLYCKNPVCFNHYLATKKLK